MALFITHLTMALGASPGDVRRLVLHEGLRLLVVGLGIGLVLSGLVAKALSGMLYEVSTADAATFTLAPLLLGLATLLACELPARRATRWRRWQRCATSEDDRDKIRSLEQRRSR